MRLPSYESATDDAGTWRSTFFTGRKEESDQSSRHGSSPTTASSPTSALTESAFTLVPLRWTRCSLRL